MKTPKLFIPMMLTFVLLTFSFRSDINLILSYKKIDGNSVTTYFQNNGSFNRNFENGNSGFEWPAGSGKFLRYSSNIVIGAVVGLDTLISSEGEFQPGYIDNNGNPQGREDPAYRVYKIIKGDSLSEDYLNWPASQGAYVKKNGKPFLIGEQNLFSSYTDGYPDVHVISAAPLQAQILETDWVFDLYGPLGTAVFSEFRIINRSNNTWNDFYFGILTDDDNGDAYDDNVCCDSILNIGYTYNSTNNDGIYGVAPPAVSLNVLSGIKQFTGSNEDSVVYYRPVTSNNKILKRGFKDVYLSSFNPFLTGDPVIGTPVNYREYYNVLSGFKKDGSNWINTFNNSPTKFPCENFGAGDYKFLISSGPANVNPGDTQTVIIAQLAARGSSNLGSITSLKSGSGLLTNNYENNFYTVSENEQPAVVNLPYNYRLYQNYPNPFNPGTKIKYSLPVSSNVKLVVYDISGKEVKVLVHQLQEAGDKEAVFDGSGLASGIYFYKLYVNNLSAVLKMILSK